MSLQFYSANKSNTGAMSSWSFNSKDQSVWVRLIKQTGSNQSASGGTNGTYKGGAAINVKFNIDEVGGIIRSARVLEPVSFFHKNPNNQTTIRFAPFEVKGQNGTSVRYGLSFKQGDLEFKIGLSIGQAEALAQYLEFSLGHIFSADYAADKKRALDAQSKKVTAPETSEQDEGATEETQETPPEDEAF